MVSIRYFCEVGELRCVKSNGTARNLPRLRAPAPTVAAISVKRTSRRFILRPYQNCSRKASCTNRGLLNWPLITPNCGVPKDRPGGENWTRLNRLNISARNWSPTRSATIKVFFTAENSKPLMPGERAFSVRPTLPNVKAGGALKSEVLNHLFNRDCAAPLSAAFCPLLLGRKLPPKELVVFTATVIG